MAEVHVPPGEATEVARKLLAAAEELGLPATVVRTASDGVWGFSFVVPQEVADRAYHGWDANLGTEEPEASEPAPEEPVKRKPGRPRKAAVASDGKPEEGK